MTQCKTTDLHQCYFSINSIMFFVDILNKILKIYLFLYLLLSF